MTPLFLLLPLLTAQADVPKTPDIPTPTRSVFLSVKSNRADLLLFRRDNDQTVCAVPCDRPVAAGRDDVYYLGGPGISASSRFDLTDVTHSARVDIRAGSRAAKILGIVFTAVSVPTLLNGAGNMLWYGIQQIPEVKSGLLSNGLGFFYNPISTLVTALVELALGAGLLTSGIILWATNCTRMNITEELPIATPPDLPTATPLRP